MEFHPIRYITELIDKVTDIDPREQRDIQAGGLLYKEARQGKYKTPEDLQSRLEQLAKDGINVERAQRHMADLVRTEDQDISLRHHL